MDEKKQVDHKEKERNQMTGYNMRDVMVDYSRELAKRIMLAQLDDKLLVDGEDYRDNVDDIIEELLSSFMGE